MNTEKITKYVLILVVFTCTFLFVEVLNGLKEYRYIGGGGIPENIIVVSGEGEVFAPPDVATFYWSVTESGANVKIAQDAVAKGVEKALASLKAMGIEDRDIKTTDFSAYPKYEYKQIFCITVPCPPGRQEIVGYEANQTVTVKVRDIAKAAEAIDAVTSSGATGVSGLSFTVDEEDKLIREARKMAIDDAKEKSKELARDLGVKLVRIVNFSEGGGPYPLYFKAETAMVGGIGGSVDSAPSLPSGENKITSNVTITYEIR